MKIDADVQNWSSVMEKQVSYRVQMVMRNKRWMALHERFGDKIFRRSSIYHGLEPFLFGSGVRGKLCYEIGTWNGLTAAVLSQFFDEVVTVDIAHNPEKHRILDFLGIKNVRCIDIQTNADKPQTLNGLKIDCAFLDGNHAEDTETDFDLVKSCGRVIFHEVWHHQSPVWETVRGLPKEEVIYGGVCFALWQRKDERP